MLWLVHRNRRNSGRVQILLSAALKIGWRIVESTPEERALLEAHGLASGAVTSEPRTTASSYRSAGWAAIASGVIGLAAYGACSPPC
jgi:hypothetical protein